MNSFAPVDPALVDQVLPLDEQGYPDELAAEDTTDVLRAVCGSATREFSDDLWIEPKDWHKVAAENDESNTWPRNYLDRYTHQQPTHECTCHSLRANFEAARNRQRAVIFRDGPKANYRYEESAKFGSVWFSAMWPYNKANPNIRGGANVRQVMEIVFREGMMPEKMQPRDYGFKHTMPGTMGKGNNNQSRGDWVSVRNMPEGWEDTAKHFKPLEVYFPNSFEQAVCLVLNGFAVSVGRNGHAVPWTALRFSGEKLTHAEYDDSYDRTLLDSVRTMQSAWRGSFAIATVTTPDDWMKPAG